MNAVHVYTYVILCNQVANETGDRPKPTRVWINPTGIHCNEMGILHQWNWHKNSPWFMGTSPSQQQKWQMLTIKHQTSKQDAPQDASACFGRFLLSWPARWLRWMDLAPKSVEGSCDLKRTLAPHAAQLWYEHIVLPSGKLTIFNGKINYKWSFSIAMLNYQRVDHVIRKNCTPDPHNDHWNRRVNCHMLLSAGAKLIETSRVGNACNSICGPKISHFAGSPKSGNRSSLSSQIHC